MTRALLSLVVAIALLVGPHVQAAILFNAASTSRVSFGDIAAIAGLNNLSVAVTVKVTATPVSGDFVVHQWGTTFANAAFQIDMRSTDEFRFLVHAADGGASTGYYGLETIGVNVASGSTYRIVATLSDLNNAGTRTNALWVNGSAPGAVDASVGMTAGTGGLTNSGSPVEVGYNSTRSAVPLDGDYGEVAIWSEKIPNWVAIGYGNGMSPAMYRTNGILYAPLININTDGLRDVWGGLLGTNTSGTAAAHPSMYRPTGGQ